MNVTFPATGNFSTLCRGHIIPKELDKETAAKFMEAAEQFERIINDSGFVRLRRLSTDEIVGTDGKAGLIERYFSLMPEGDATLQDIDLSAREMRIGDNRLCLHTLSDAEDLPGTVATDTRYEKLSDAGGTQCGTGGHADQERGSGACVFVFHRRHSLRIKIFGLRG